MSARCNEVPEDCDRNYCQREKKCAERAASAPFESPIMTTQAHTYKQNEALQVPANPPSAAPDISQNCLPNGIRHLMPMIRVACITLDGTTLIVPAKELADHMAALDDSAGAIEGDEVIFTLTFKTMLVRDFEELGEFNGF